MSNTNAPVSIVPNKDTNEIIVAYKSNPDYGYLQVQCVQLVTVNGFLRESKRSALLRGKVTLLSLFVKHDAKNLIVPGRITVSEFVESQIPESFRKTFNEKLTEEENLAQILKRAGKDGDVLTLKGERIVRFSVYDSTGSSTDTIVQHDAIGSTPVSGASSEGTASLES